MSDPTIKKKKIILLIFFIAVILYGYYEYLQQIEIKKDGVYTKASIVNSEGYKGGLMITLNYMYLGKKYEGIVNSDLGKSAIGRQYFIQLKSRNPKAIVFLRDKPVPDCLTNIEAPKDGWEKIPSCP